MDEANQGERLSQAAERLIEELVKLLFDGLVVKTEIHTEEGTI